MMKVYKAVHERENKCKELHKEMNMNVGPTRLVQPDFYLLVDVDDLQKQVNTLENEVHRMKRAEATVMTLKGVRLNAKGIIAGVVTALAVGLPVFAYGSVLNSGPYKTLGSLLTVLLSGLIALTASGKERHYAR